MLFNTEAIKQHMQVAKPEISTGHSTQSVHKISGIEVQLVRLSHLKDLLGTLPEENQFYFTEQVKSFNGISFIKYVAEQFGHIDRLYATSFNLNREGIDFFMENSSNQVFRFAHVVVNNKFREADAEKFYPVTSLSNHNEHFEFQFRNTHKKSNLS